MGKAKQILYDMLVEEFRHKPDFLLARTLYLFCHFNPAFEMPSEIMETFIQGLMEYEVRAFSLNYSIPCDNHENDAAGRDKQNELHDAALEKKKRDIYKEIAAENLSDGTGKAYTAHMLKDITTRFSGIMSYNDILEMFIVASAQQRSANWELSEFTAMLKTFPVFSSLGEDDLTDLFTLLQFKRFNPDERILSKGDPGTHLYIILTGTVEVVGDNEETISVLESGGIFGEMSLLTGASVVASVYSRGVTKLAALTSKDFKHVLHRYPALHVFFYGLLIERAGKKMTTDISTGMSGDIADVHVVELFQMINASQKTGTVMLKLKNGNAKVYFNQGEIVYADYGRLQGRRAIFALLGLTKGQFMYSPKIPTEAEEHEIIGGFMGLVMEGMQRLDEETDMAEEHLTVPDMEGITHN